MGDYIRPEAQSDSRLGIVQLVLVLGAPIAFASLLKGNTRGCNAPLSNHLALQPFILRKVMSSFSSLDDRRGCNLTVRSVQSTQWMWRYPLMTLAALFALVQAPLSSQAAGEKKLEVFSWWTSGGEAAALDALFTVYNKQHPGVEIVNATVAGGGGSAARSALHTRLAGGNPPDTWAKPCRLGVTWPVRGTRLLRTSHRPLQERRLG